MRAAKCFAVCCCCCGTIAMSSFNHLWLKRYLSGNFGGKKTLDTNIRTNCEKFIFTNRSSAEKIQNYKLSLFCCFCDLEETDYQNQAFFKKCSFCIQHRGYFVLYDVIVFSFLVTPSADWHTVEGVHCTLYWLQSLLLICLLE